MDTVNSPPMPSASKPERGRFPILSDLPLRAKLLLVFLIITALSASSVAFFSDQTTTAGLTTDVGAALKNTANQSGLTVGEYLNRQISLLRSFGLSKIVQDGVLKASESYTSTATIQSGIEAIDRQWIKAKDTDPLIQSKITNEIAGELQEYRSTFPDNVEVFVTDKYGALVASTNRTSDYYQADEGWWQKAWNKGQGAIYIGQPVFDQSAQILGLTIAIPLYGHNSQEVVGVLRSTFRLDNLVKQIDSVRIGQTGKAELFLTEAQYLTSDQKVVDFDPATLSRILSSTSDYLEMSYENSPSFVTHALVTTVSNDPAIANLGWSVVVHQDRDETLQPVAATQQTIFLTSLGTLLLSGLAALLIAQLISAPIGRLTTAAQQLAAGDLSKRLGMRRRDEIGKLATSFDKMAQSLEDRIAAEQLAREEAQRLQQAETKNRQTLERAVTEYLSFVEKVAQGDLSQRLKSRYTGALGQLAEGLNGMVDSLRDITGQVQESTNALAAAIAQISAAATQQAASAAEQSAAITETATTVEEIKTLALQTAEQTALVAQNSQTALQIARDGSQVVGEAVGGMGQIRQEVLAIAQTIHNLAAQNRAISMIITSVSELADQINNLGRNAAIESTRAGRGDIDVEGLARMMRELAEQAKNSTNEVRGILTEIQRATQSAVEVADEGTRRAELSAQLATQAGSLIEQIAGEVEKGTQANTQVAAATQQQTLGMEQIGQAMTAIQQATTQALAGTRQVEGAAQDLQKLAHALQEATATYRL